MSDFDFSVDDILNEFYKDLEGEKKHAEEENAVHTLPKEIYAPPKQQQTEPSARPESGQPAEEPVSRPAYRPEYNVQAQEHRTEAAPERVQKPAAQSTARPQQKDFEDFFAAVTENEKAKEKLRRESYAEVRQTTPPPVEEEDVFDDDYEDRKLRKPIYTSKRNRGKMLKLGMIRMLGTVCAVVSLLIIVWVGINVHPESETMTFSKTNAKTNLISRLDTYSNNSKVDVLSSVEEIAEQAVIKKVYKIPEDQLVAPSPISANFGKCSINEASKVMDIIAQAKVSGLLEDQDVLFNPNANFYWDSDIEYYLDDTIMVICWKEQIEGRVTSMVEVKIADGSQLRRKICEDTYGSSVYLYCSELAQQANAVIAMNSDYYAFRDLGITCYDRTVYRFNDYNYYGMYKAYNVTDTLFINPDGDFVFFKRGTETTKDEVQQWVNDNNLLYSIAFGPILVDNYELVDIPDYPVGEINTEYSRAGISQIDRLHYLYMAVSHSNESTPRCTVIQFAQIFKDKGVKCAYCLDGGQTGEVFFQGKPYNHIDFGNERTVSDIIYFATAMGEEAVQ